MNRIVTCALLALLFACSPTPSTKNTGSVLSDTAGNLGKIRSGALHVVMQTAASGHKPSGFEIDGPFSFTSPGSFPILDVTVKRYDETRSDESRLVSTGTKVFAGKKGGTLQPVPPSELGGLNGLGQQSGSNSNALGRFDVGSWITGKSTITAGGLVGTTDTDKVSADLDVGAVLNGLVELAKGFNATAAQQLSTLDSAERQRVRNSVKHATLEVYSGRKDRIMRKLVMDVEFGTSNTQLTKLKALSGITLHFEVRITDLNKPVKAPTPSP